MGGYGGVWGGYSPRSLNEGPSGCLQHLLLCCLASIADSPTVGPSLPVEARSPRSVPDLMAYEMRFTGLLESDH